MFEKVKAIVEYQLDLKDPSIITRETRLREDLKVDSLDAAEIILAIEDKLDVEIPDELMMNAKTVGEIMDYLEANY
ncbi:acyl carrier protein [Acidaminobacter sp. JC074]|uniref:acyl carrier protein n=1 Tax=Acidaminobacter sp. JC074 TaxID=2530199 RepID=UPI001F10D1EA|nr:acyl carrier protein [Acidaminobacter sp. JC074]MCH4891287.1 acyl carrier protein [Acidaminobacter sp. JC074]